MRGWRRSRRARSSTGRSVGRMNGRSERTKRSSLLRAGRDVIGPGALAMEIGDLLAATGDPLGAADEWATGRRG